MYFTLRMKLLKRTWRAIRKPFQSKRVKALTAGLLGGIIGTVTGGPCVGLTMAVMSTIRSIKSRGIVLCISSRKNNERSKERKPVVKLPFKEKVVQRVSVTYVVIVSYVVIEYEIVPYTRTIVLRDSPVQYPSKDVTQKDRNDILQKIIEWLGYVVNTGMRYQLALERMNEGPRYEILPTDTSNIALLKSRANNLLSDIEENAGNYTATHRPILDIITGSELLNTLDEIRKNENNCTH